MKGWHLENVAQLHFREIETPFPKSEEVIVRVKACGVCGSDIPRIFEKGTYSFPTIPGHELSGVIEKIGEGVSNDYIGKKVAVFPLIPCQECISCQIGQYAQCENYNYIGSRCDGGFAEFVKVPLWNLFVLPENITYEEAAMIEPAAVALHTLRQAQLDFRDNVLILGAGPIGLLLASLAKAWGAKEVLLIDIDEEKVEFAGKMGFSKTFHAKDKSLSEWIMNATNHKGVDIAIEGAGSSVALQQCIQFVRQFGTIVLMGNASNDMLLPKETYSHILRQELTIKGTWNSVVSHLPKNEWKEIIHLMSDKKLNVTPFITHKIEMKQLMEYLVKIKEKEIFYNKLMVVN
ncbi:galactitol-1-phosphate 5-dehydrogenase [Gracilibacillus sp. YIM 98692]|uniref:galactitol-1-phosphate 5-dehydrogenase n=1 Tax=Gracilibacillus sp. YIM 98692 TaxID=2663532 RepID=UPI0013D4A330|nr:galactitol-1-phosphate 5-dehydrogenase [Gracilibacillus sp. YIM 98692]